VLNARLNPSLFSPTKDAASEALPPGLRGGALSMRGRSGRGTKLLVNPALLISSVRDIHLWLELRPAVRVIRCADWAQPTDWAQPICHEDALVLAPMVIHVSGTAGRDHRAAQQACVPEATTKAC
jgi:hypothetical protein